MAVDLDPWLVFLSDSVDKQEKIDTAQPESTAVPQTSRDVIEKVSNLADNPEESIKLSDSKAMDTSEQAVDITQSSEKTKITQSSDIQDEKANENTDVDTSEAQLTSQTEVWHHFIMITLCILVLL